MLSFFACCSKKAKVNPPRHEEPEDSFKNQVPEKKKEKVLKKYEEPYKKNEPVNKPYRPPVRIERKIDNRSQEIPYLVEPFGTMMLMDNDGCHDKHKHHHGRDHKHEPKHEHHASQPVEHKPVEHHSALSSYRHEPMLTQYNSGHHNHNSGWGISDHASHNHHHHDSGFGSSHHNHDSGFGSSHHHHDSGFSAPSHDFGGHHHGM